MDKRKFTIEYVYCTMNYKIKRGKRNNGEWKMIAMVPNCPKWSQMVPNSLKWSQNVPYGPKVSQMAKNGSMWSQMFTTVPTWSLLCV